eukprot:5784533-Amphidinium_carterae.2
MRSANGCVVKHLVETWRPRPHPHPFCCEHVFMLYEKQIAVQSGVVDEPCNPSRSDTASAGVWPSLLVFSGNLLVA